jgi:glutaredoxin
MNKNMKKILKFELPTCGPCKALEQVLKSTGVEYEKVDCSSEKGLELSEKYNISHVPTLVKIDEFGNLIDSCSIIVLNDKLKEFLEIE